ncbi:hypothetical protein BH10CYA1_BH10CYA1_03820 [soil metagenome]
MQEQNGTRWRPLQKYRQTELPPLQVPIVLSLLLNIHTAKVVDFHIYDESTSIHVARRRK